MHGCDRQFAVSGEVASDALLGLLGLKEVVGDKALILPPERMQPLPGIRKPTHRNKSSQAVAFIAAGGPRGLKLQDN